MTVEQGIGDSSIEKFPIGMRVLAVDDDPTCLLLLEILLRRCQYNEAVPKKILDLMNAEKLTRENVASHLQKYRLYLERISTVANQQANRVAAPGSSDASYLQINSMSRLGLHNLAGSAQFHSTPFRSLPSSGMLDRLNSMSSNAGQLINNGPLGWDDHRQDDPYHSNGLSNSLNSAIPINGNGNPNGCNLDANSLFFQRTSRFSSTGLSNFVDTSLMKHNEVECSAMETLVRSRDGYFPSQEKPQDGSVLNNFGSLEDLVSVMVNQPAILG